MRITHVSHELPPYELAGTAIYTLEHRQGPGGGRSRRLRLRAPAGSRGCPRTASHDESRDGLRIRFVNRADLDWVAARALLPRRPDEEAVRRVPRRGQARHRPLPAPRGARPRMPRGGHGARHPLRDDAPRLLGDVPDGAARLLHRLPDLRSDQVREVRAVRVRERMAGSRRAMRPRDPARPARARSSGSSPTTARASPRRLAASRAARGRAVAPRVRTVRVVRRTRLRRPRRAASARRPRNPFVARFEEVREGAPRHRSPDHAVGVPARRVHQALRRDARPHRPLRRTEWTSRTSRGGPKVPSRKLRFGYVGSIIKTKGIHVLVDAFLRAADRALDLELHVFGSPNRWTARTTSTSEAAGRLTARS